MWSEGLVWSCNFTQKKTCRRKQTSVWLSQSKVSAWERPERNCSSFIITVSSNKNDWAAPACYSAKAKLRRRQQQQGQEKKHWAECWAGWLHIRCLVQQDDDEAKDKARNVEPGKSLSDGRINQNNSHKMIQERAGKTEGRRRVSDYCRDRKWMERPGTEGEWDV